MQVLKCAGCAGVATGSILVYAYILMYYIKERGFRGGGYLKAEGEREENRISYVTSTNSV